MCAISVRSAISPISTVPAFSLEYRAPLLPQAYPRIMTMSPADQETWKEMLASSRGNRRLTTTLKKENGSLLHREEHTAGPGGDRNITAEWWPCTGALEYVAELEAYVKVAGIADEADIGNTPGALWRTSRRQERGLGALVSQGSQTLSWQEVCPFQGR